MNGIVLALLAGCATGLGALPILWITSYKPTSLAAGMSLAAGVMTYLTFVEIYPEVQSIFTKAFAVENQSSAKLLALICCCITFFLGWALADVLNRTLHHIFRDPRIVKHASSDLGNLHDAVPGVSSSDLAAFEAQMTLRSKVMEEKNFARDRTSTAATSPNSSTSYSVEQVASALADEIFQKDHVRLLRVGWFTALALSMHNLPEGVATYTGSAANSKLALGITMAIGIHNLPEGLAVAIPIFYSTRSAKYAVLIAWATGMAEPLGAILAWAILGPNPNPLTYGTLLGLVSGIMVNVALKELFFGAARYDPNDKITTTMFVAGMGIIAVSLVALEMLLPEH